MKKFNFTLNPFFVFQIRQIARSRTCLAFLCLYALTAATSTGWGLIAFGMDNPASQVDGIGSEVASFLLLLLMVFSSTAVFVFTWATSRDEDNHHELLFATPLTPVQIGIGKVQAAAFLTMLFYAASMPYFTVAWMFRGVDVLTLGTILFCSFLNIQAVNTYLAAAIFHCSSGKHRAAAVFSLFVSAPVLMNIWCGPVVPVVFEGLSGWYIDYWLMGFTSCVITAVMLIVAADMYKVNHRSLPCERFWCNSFSAYSAALFTLFVGFALGLLLYSFYWLITVLWGLL